MKIILAKQAKVTCDLNSPNGLATHIGEWVSANFQPCYSTIIKDQYSNNAANPLPIENGATGQLILVQKSGTD